MRTVFVGVIAVVAVIAAGWILVANHLAQQKVFAPQFEQVRRETFEQSKAFRDGAVQELRSLQIDYIRADAEVKPALAAAIKHKAAALDDHAMPQDLSTFIKELP